MEENQKSNQAKTACGGTLKDAKGYPSAIYRDERIYFCTQGCLRAFEREPDRFMKGEIAHPETED
jgi:YHS domain-containing protein